MIESAKRIVLRFLERAGYRLLKRADHDRLLASVFDRPQHSLVGSAAPPSPSSSSGETEKRCDPRAMRVIALRAAARYLFDRSITGDVVDCGYGGTATLSALAADFYELGDTSRRLVLFDTTADPLNRADTELEPWGVTRDLVSGPVRSRAPCKPEPPPPEILETGYPADKVIVLRYPRDPMRLPGPVAFLGLTSDTYDQNRAAIEAFWPTLSVGGVVAVEGLTPRDAVDEFLARASESLFFVPVLEGYKIAVKL